MTYRSCARTLSVLGVACLAGLTITTARAADFSTTARTIQASSTAVTALTRWFTPDGALPSWSAKASNGRHSRPKGGKSLH